MVSSDGRLIYVFDEAPVGAAGPARPQLIARDAFNGLLLWKRAVDRKFVGSFQYKRESGSQQFKPTMLAAEGDRIYCVLEAQGPVSALDAATGQVLRTFPGVAPEEILVLDKTLLAASPDSTAAFDAVTGVLRWQVKPGGTAWVAGEGKAFFQNGALVFCVDLASAASTASTASRTCFQSCRPAFWTGRSMPSSRSRIAFHRAGTSLASRSPWSSASRIPSFRMISSRSVVVGSFSKAFRSFSEASIVTPAEVFAAASIWLMAA
jgi:hypothetical protein